ncbi:MAG: hypothetical protein M3Q63_03735 [bacterium]|nr:hypothetical protein [bacterium]
MVYIPKEERNKSIVQKRIKDPKKWTWGSLAEAFGIHRSVAKEIFERDYEKYANEEQIEQYEKLMRESKKKL